MTLGSPEPAVSSRPDAGTPFSLSPTSKRVFVEGCSVANCVFRRSDRYPFLGASSSLGSLVRSGSVYVLGAAVEEGEGGTGLGALLI